MVLSDYYFRGHQIELTDNTTRYGRFLGTNSKMLYFVGAGMIANIECNKVSNIFDGQGINIPFNCNDNTFLNNTPSP